MYNVQVTVDFGGNLRFYLHFAVRSTQYSFQGTNARFYYCSVMFGSHSEDHI